MKTWKHYGLVVIIAIVGIIGIAFISCQPEPKPDPAHVHDWNWVITIPATIEMEGIETETCSTCGVTRGTRPIAKIVLSWTVGDSSIFGAAKINSLSFGNGKWFAVGYDYNSETDNRIVYSTNGVNWSTLNNNLFEFNVAYIYYMGDKWIAGADKRAYSNDGVNWTVGNNPFTGTIWTEIQFLGNKFFAGGDNGKLTYSTDIINWTDVNDSTFGSDAILRIAYGNGKWVIVGDKGKIAYSTDGINWTAVTNSPATTAIRGLTFANDKFVAIERNKHTLYSTDGINWTAGTDLSNIYTSGGSPSVDYCGDKFIVNVEEGKIAYSENGISWSVADISNIFSGSSYAINGICWGNGIFIAFGSSWDGTLKTPKMAYSTNCQMWTEMELTGLQDSGSYSIYQVYYGNGRFVGWGHNNIMIYSNTIE